MPQLVDGNWVKDDVAASEMKDGAFHREQTTFRDWLTPDGSPGPEGQKGIAAEAGRVPALRRLSLSLGLAHPDDAQPQGPE